MDDRESRTSETFILKVCYLILPNSGALFIMDRCQILSPFERQLKR